MRLLVKDIPYFMLSQLCFHLGASANPESLKVIPLAPPLSTREACFGVGRDTLNGIAISQEYSSAVLWLPGTE
jgi:hypothetical protein